jgi:voltage-gated potassium channel
MIAVSDPLTRFATKRLWRAFQSGRILPSMVVTILLLTLAFAAIMRIVDHEDFPSYGLAVWWAISTVTTVGYGDVVPTTAPGRAVASLLMAVGFAFLSLVTGTIASLLVARHEELQGPKKADLTDALERIEERLERLERRLEP